MSKCRPLIAVLVDEADKNFICGALNVIQRELFDANMDVVIFSTLLTRHEEISIENKLFDIVNFDLIDGAIVFLKGLKGDEIQNTVAEKLKNFGKPVVYMDEFIYGENNTVFDYTELANETAEHLAYVHGVKTAAYVDGHDPSEYFECLRKNFLDAMGQNGISVPEGLDFFGKDLKGDFSGIADKIIDRGLPNAVLCCSNYSAAALIGEFSRRNIRVPEDVIVVGSCSGEPYDTNLNISSVRRDPTKIAANAARKIISAINGTQFVPYDGVSCRFESGFSCGCSHIDLQSLSKTVMNEMTPHSSNGFDSCYNYMQEELISAPSFTDFLWKLDWYTFFLGDLKGFWMCLNDNIMHTGDAVVDYTDNINLPYFRMNGHGSVDEQHKFSRSEMLPYIFENREKPSAFIFTPLHFDNVNFGYIVLSYGDSGAVFDRIYYKWIRYVTCGLEKQRRHTIYCDDTVNAQIRDTLTGLLNMRGFKRIMTEEFSRNRDQLLRIISVDVDNLNGINKAYGYKEGDKVLQKIGVILNNSAGDSDICVRVSGDEFIIAGILDHENSVDEVPLKLERNLEAYNSSSSNEYGINIFSSRVTAVFDSLDLLDKLPYDASYQRNMVKDNRNKKRILRLAEYNEDDFDPEERMYVGKMLNDNLLSYQFQPIVDAHTGEVFAYEALMRSVGDMKISPVSILNHASALGRLSDVERLTLMNTFEFLSKNRDKFESKLLFVNCIPSCVLSDEDFDELYSKYSNIMDKIVLEFTEQTEASSEQLRMIVARSQRVNCKIAIDDYGTGYSNISNLLTFMPHCVKIDRSLIMNIQSDKRKQYFTRNIIEYAHDNNFKALAEGVETSEELAAVISMGVDLIQGYYAAKPSYELIESVAPEVSSEIISAYGRSRNIVYQKTYFTGDEKSRDIKSLDLESYTHIFISSNEYTLYGKGDYTSEIAVTVKDGIECVLNLVDTNIRNECGEPCIKLGNGSKLTLNIIGDVTVFGAILVPETAALNIIGGGTLSVIQKSDCQFAIGNDLNHSYGNIAINLDNRIDIKVGAEKCVAIGGGTNGGGSIIDVRTKDMSVDISGKHVLGIGSFFSDTKVRINDSAVAFRMQCEKGIAMGGYGIGMNVSVNNSSFDIKADGKNISGIYSVDAGDGNVLLSNSNVNMTYNGEFIHAIGFEYGFGKISAENSICNIRIEGDNAYVIGSRDKDAEIAIGKCKGSLFIASSNANLILAHEEMVSITESEFSQYEK